MSQRGILLLFGAVIVAAIAAMTWFLTRGNDEPDSLTLTSGQEGGVYRPLADGMANVLPGVTVVGSEGSAENLRRVAAGEADLGLVENARPDEVPDVRTLVPLHIEVLHFLKRRDVSIDNLDDIRGKSIAVGSRGSGTERLARLLLEHFAIEYTDFKPQFLGAGDAADALLAGTIDAMLFVSGLKSSVCQRAIDSGQVTFVGLGRTQEVWGQVEGIRYDHPFIERAVIPRFTYGSDHDDVLGEPREAITTVGVRALLVCRGGLPKKTARGIVQSIYERRADLVRAHRVAAQIREGFDPAALQFPLHEGAEAYLRREEPGFLVTYAESMGFVLSLIAALFAVVTGIKSWYRQKLKDRIDAFYTELSEMSDRIDAPDTSPEDLRRLRGSLTEVRQRAFRDLVREKLAANQSFAIFQTLLTDCQTRLDLRLRS